MPMVSIKIAKGRSLDQKRRLACSVTDAIVSSIDVPPEKIWIQIDEFEPENFAVNGRLLADKDRC
jgi:4-oxalocrotonate tautomerase